jgi:hypothetical protein
MAESPIYKFEVQVLNSEGITLDSIARNPRIYKPQDLQVACYNTNIICKSGQPESSVVAMVEYVVLEYFVLAHRTGLYNRQKQLWESITKVSSAAVYQLKQGVFRKQPLPQFDFHFLDHRGRILVFGHLAFPADSGERDNRERHLAGFLKRAEKFGPLAGLFLCFPEPFPPAVQAKVSKLTGASDPVGKYESVLPAPWSCPLDLLSIASIEVEEDQALVSKPKLRLVHPDLTASKRIRAASISEEV